MISRTEYRGYRVVERLGRNSARAVGDGTQVKVTTVNGADVVALRDRATLLQRLQTLPTASFRLPHVISSRSAREGDAQEWTVVREFVPGQDLTRLVIDANGAMAPSLIGAVGRSIGEELGRLHQASSSYLVRELLDGDLDELAAAWAVASVRDFHTLAERVETAPVVGRLGEEALASARIAIRALVSRLIDGWYRPRTTNPCLIHGDVHGGNIIITFEPETGRPKTTFIDEQLAVGDAVFDLASLQNWAFEVLQEELLPQFLRGLRSGYRSEAPGLATSPAMLTHCHALRALGRLAYYARSNPQWVEPFGPTHLSRQVTLLTALAADNASGTTHVDPTNYLWRHLTNLPTP